MILATFIIYWINISPITASGCEFPSSWRGDWFMSARANNGPMVITKHKFGNARCIEEGKKARYLVKVESPECTCHKCMVINQKHSNVIRFKESYCDCNTADINIKSLCEDITGDYALTTIFRLEANPVSCPFKGPITFTYAKGFDECLDPVSQIDSCADDSRLLFRYQACPDVSGSENFEEELQCLGSWEEGLSQYLVGKVNHTHAKGDEYRYRCFIFDRPQHYGGTDSKITWNLAQSADAMCQLLVSATEGARTMKLTKNMSTEKRCKFPRWLTSDTHWQTLDYKQSYFIHNGNTSVRVSYGSSAPKNLEERSQTDVKMVCHSYADHTWNRAHDPEDHHVDSHERRDHHGNTRRNRGDITTIIVHVTVACRSGYKCLRIYRRDKQIVQIQSGALAYHPDEACNNYYWNPKTTNFTTLVAQGVEGKECQPVGRYSIPSGHSKVCDDSASFSHMIVGCTADDTIKFHSGCPEVEHHSYQCHGQWKNKGNTYIVASPKSRPSGAIRRVCFVHPSGTDSFTITARHDNCVASQLDAPLLLNVTRIGNCEEASSHAASGATVAESSIHKISIIVLVTIISIVSCSL